MSVMLVLSSLVLAATPSPLEEVMVPAPPGNLIDHEIDRQNKRVVTAEGGAQELLVGNFVGATVSWPAANPVDTGATPGGGNGGHEFGMGPGVDIGVFYNKQPAGLSEIWYIDQLVGPALVIANPNPGGELFIMDGWEGLTYPLVLASTQNTPTLGLPLWVYDDTNSVWPPATGKVHQVPNYAAYFTNTVARPIRVVPEFPATVQVQNVGNLWWPRWQQLDDLPHFSATDSFFETFVADCAAIPGTEYDDTVEELRGVGVERVEHVGTVHTYFIYVVRREVASPYDDTIDWFLFEYDTASPTTSFVSDCGTVPFDHAVFGSFTNIGDDESYIDPDGNPVVALSVVESDVLGNPGDPNVQNGAIGTMTVRLGIASDYAMLTPGGAAAGPRKDPESIVVGTDVYIFHRYKSGAGGNWRLRRTHSFEP